MVLEDILDELPALNGLISTASSSLPPDEARRREIYDRVLREGCDLHAAVEEIALSSRNEHPGRRGHPARQQIRDHPVTMARSGWRSWPRSTCSSRCTLRPSGTSVQRVVEHDKAESATVARQWGRDYWDGDRRYGYGGYRYDGRWRPLAQTLIDRYGIKPGMSVLDVGCGKGYLLYEFTQLVPDLQDRRRSTSPTTASRNAKEEVRPQLKVGSAVELPYPDHSFDLVVSLGVLHNLPLEDVFARCSRSNASARGASKYLMVESFRNEREKANLLYLAAHLPQLPRPGNLGLDLRQMRLPGRPWVHLLRMRAGLRRPTSLRAQNPEVYYSDDAIVTADDATIAELKRIAAGNPRLRSRLCTHPDPSSGLHEMLIVHHREAYVPWPHKHVGKPGPFHLIEGTAQVVIFEDDGRIRDVLEMAPYGHGGALLLPHAREGLPLDPDHLRSGWCFTRPPPARSIPPAPHFRTRAPDGGDVAAVQAYVARTGTLAAEHLAGTIDFDHSAARPSRRERSRTTLAR